MPITAVTISAPNRQHLSLDGLHSPVDILLMAEALQLPELSAEQGQLLIRTHLDAHVRSQVTRVIEIQNHSFSYSSNIRTYILDIVGPDVRGPCSCFVTLSLPPSPEQQSAPYHTNALPAMRAIISLILESTSIPIHSTSKLDTSLTLVPFHYILSPPAPISSDTILPLSVARKRGMLSPQVAAGVDLITGKFLGQMHNRCQNDWFGLVKDPSGQGDGDGADDSRHDSDSTKYSWQETFTMLFETVLSDLETLRDHEDSNAADIPFKEIRLYLSRAIGFFLFDDVQVPSLVWFTGSEDDIYISPSQFQNPSCAGLAAILPNVSHALWGDPLLETFFMEQKSETFMEAYKESRGEDVIYLPRQKTKRIWYTLFLALIVLRERGANGGGCLSPPSGVDIPWAKKMIAECTKALKDAPCH